VRGADSLVTTQGDLAVVPSVTGDTAGGVATGEPVVQVDPSNSGDLSLATQSAIEPTEDVVDLALSRGTGRVADAIGNEYRYTVASDGTISLDRSDIDRSSSRTFMVTKLKPGNKSMTVTFVAPAGLKNVKIKASPSGRSLVCSPGKKFS